MGSTTCQRRMQICFTNFLLKMNSVLSQYSITSILALRLLLPPQPQPPPQQRRQQKQILKPLHSNSGSYYPKFRLKVLVGDPSLQSLSSLLSSSSAAFVSFG